MKAKIHINQHVIRANKKNNVNNPVITIKTYKSNEYAHEVIINGKSKVIYSPNKPLSHQYKVGQRDRVYNTMLSGRWLTLGAIREKTGDAEASISAQLRHLRKEKHGSHATIQ